jgi:hypothetical protein
MMVAIAHAAPTAPAPIIPIFMNVLVYAAPNLMQLAAANILSDR